MVGGAAVRRPVGSSGGGCAAGDGGHGGRVGKSRRKRRP